MCQKIHSQKITQGIFKMEVGMSRTKYFADRKAAPKTAIKIFLALLLAFSVAFFVWSIMRYNEIMEQKEQKQAYINELNDEIDRLEYLVDAPLDDAYKIRIARERLGMCFPDEIIYHN